MEKMVKTDHFWHFVKMAILADFGQVRSFSELQVGILADPGQIGHFGQN